MSLQDTRRSPKAAGAEDYTAIVYFHGIGVPRRWEEISRLADAFDQFAETQDAASVGRLRSHSAGLEPSRVESEEDVAYVQMTRIVERFKGPMRPEGTFRIYDGFWSPSVAGGFSPLRVLLWTLQKSLHPLKVIFRPWRAHQRLKLSFLYRISFGDEKGIDVYRQLESHYINFENWAARRSHPIGRFSEFLAYIKTKHHKNIEIGQRLCRAARMWRRMFLLDQVKILVICITVIIGAAEVTLVFYYLAMSVLAASWPDSAKTMWPTAELPLLNLPLYLTLMFLGIFCYFIYKVGFYLSNYWADVMFWTTYEEKDLRHTKRREILRLGERALLQVLRDPSCKRIVVIGHSLGSAVAYECLLRLGRHKVAREREPSLPFELTRLTIISHFITLGSPIDRINYFFELHQSKYHRYNRIRDRLLGNTGDVPFFDGAEVRTKWVNIWDDDDPISSKLFSPLKRMPNSESICNILSPSSFLVSPISSHLNYFSSRLTMETMFWIAFFGRLPKFLRLSPDIKSFSGFFLTNIKCLTKYFFGSSIWALMVMLLSIHFRVGALFYVSGLTLGACVGAFFLIQAVGLCLNRKAPLRFESETT